MNADLVEYILADVQNVRIAAAVAEAWPQVQRKAADGFRSRIQARLSPQLPGWNLEPHAQPYLERKAALYLWKPHWHDYFGVALQWWRSGVETRVGVYRESDDDGKLPRVPGLLAAVKQAFPSARDQSWWEALIPCRDPGPDWTTPEVIGRMAGDPEFADEVAGNLLELARLAEPILDAAVERLISAR